MPRPIWNGAISWGLVSIPVSVVSAIGSGHKIAFHQMHAEDQGRVRVRKVCDVDGEELGEDDIVRGYTAPDGRVALITDEDLDDIPLPTAHTIEAHGFVGIDDIPLTQLGRPYYLQPGKAGAKPYTLFRDALARKGKAAVTKFAMHGSEKLALIRAHGDILVLHQLRWPDEVRSAADAAPPEHVTVTDQEIDAAEALLLALGEVDLDDERDEYQRAVEQLVTAKLGGEELPAAAPEEDRGAPVVDIMAALRQSLEDAEKRKAKPGRDAKKSTAKKATAKKTAAKKTTSRGGGGSRRAS
jgi:DNA end-binding protein Ku